MSEELIIRHCSPTLAGIKTANMFSCSFETKEQLYRDIRLLNRRLASRGLRVVPLRICDKTALIYIYRPSKLRKDFTCEKSTDILKECGYKEENPEKCIVQLVHRLKAGNDFPHEIGLFLGYPPEDVKGFIDNEAQNFKLIGCWKVYGDEAEAKKKFELYKKCKNVYMRCYEGGKCLESLAVKV